MSGLLEGHLRRVRDVLRSRVLGARRGLSQNFLLDPALLRRQVAVLGDVSGRRVVEIGPGPGGLTVALLEAGARVTAFELDRGWAAFLCSARATRAGLDVVEADVRAAGGQAFSAALRELRRSEGRPLLLASNLPYHIASPVIVDLVAHEDPPEQMMVTVQAEVAERLLAAPGSSERGLLTLLVTLRARVARCFGLPAGAFRPPPKVASTVLRIEPDARLRSRFDAQPRLEEILRLSFQGRRKMLRRSLASLLPADPAVLDADLLARRPQDLHDSEWLLLAQRIAGARPFS